MSVQVLGAIAWSGFCPAEFKKERAAEQAGVFPREVGGVGVRPDQLDVPVLHGSAVDLRLEAELLTVGHLEQVFQRQCGFKTPTVIGFKDKPAYFRVGAEDARNG